MQVILRYEKIPTFVWERVEGAAAYDVQTDDDQNFGSPLFTTTPTTAIKDGTYWWRVRAIRYSNLRGDWTVKKLVIGTILQPNKVYLSAVIHAS